MKTRLVGICTWFSMGIADVCTRECKNYPHVIVWGPKLSPPAGLGDRAVVMTGLGNIATSLCAMVLAPSPQKALHQFHNSGKKIHETRPWNYYIRAIRRVDNRSFLLETGHSEATNETQYATIIRSTDVTKIGEDYVRAFHATNSGNRTLWYLDAPFYHWAINHYMQIIKQSLGGSLGLLPRNEKGDLVPKIQVFWKDFQACSYTVVVTGDLPAQIADMALLHTGIRNVNEISTVHIRSLDNPCNNTLPAVRKYLECSDFSNVKERDVLLFSNNMDDTYRASIMNIIAELSTARVFDGDKLLLDYDKTRSSKLITDNYIMYAAVSYIIGESRSAFAITHYQCNSCGQKKSCHPCMRDVATR
mmetsp:Transcript_12257/g.16548  ORF Transcript_12257/g.16548 Transcript_12257/m.16548 type:complete len:361 (+) Transcript_12257:1075-2157(+)|eukprot:CAMPEP_0197287880 /NCGR_PEP_ID=MMETSP0890-20130614/4692_1 /TAXON_ID=44058 ORGANISM="Aureoumbra lagunensis, Strain CCMP1510" /NCGR_SAMPLE_ID=MMETSP0890 /ASSEMBLY_ACC=CAM_ASM_000533 /LENGTH=360 /DNA_ID=CAMNT_0042758107 /DNA_START=789 /DNA_END=1871 /DNA_ORIENTATION=-